jgi:hypothetical protein
MVLISAGMEAVKSCRDAGPGSGSIRWTGIAESKFADSPDRTITGLFGQVQ